MIALVADKQPEIADLCRKYGVRRLEVFGSAATGDFDPLTSDLDFLVELDAADDSAWHHRYFPLRTALRWLLGRSVDLVLTDAPNDEVFWQTANRSREVIYDVAAIPEMAHRSDHHHRAPGNDHH